MSRLLVRADWRRLSSAFATAVAMLSSAVGTAWSESLPTVAEVLDGTPFSPGDARTVVAGKIAVTPVDGISNRELVVGISCLVPDGSGTPTPKATPQPMLPTALMQQFEVIDLAASAMAFDKLSLEESGKAELKRYVEFEPGIGLNLSAAELSAFEALAAAHEGRPGDERINRELRKLLEARLRSYDEKGLSGIAPYLREDGELAHPADELRRTLDQAHVMEKRYPKFFEFWNRFPEFELPDADQRYFWVRSTIRDRPAILLAHQTSWQDGDAWMIGERHFYVSHFFNGGYVVVFRIPVREGLLFAMMERLWVDGYSGMAGLKHTMGRKLLAGRLRDETRQRKVCPAG